MARWAAVLAVLAAALAVVLAANDHSSVTFEPTVPKFHVRRPAFTAGRSAHVDLPQPLFTAVQFVKSWVPNVEFVVKDYFVTKKTGVAHVYLRQLVNGLEVANGDANVNVDARGAITSAYHSFFTGETHGLNSLPRVAPADAARALATYVNARAGDIRAVHIAADGRSAVLTQGDFASTEIKASLGYIQSTEGALRLVWNINADTTDNWYDAFVNAENTAVEAVHDWVHYASYNVYPIGINDPDDGSRSVITDPATSNASPLGWHDQGNGDSFTSTVGNNVWAQENWSGSSSGWEDNYRPDAGASLNFNYPINFSQDPEEYIDAAVSNLFYWNNIIHDVFYEYGFDEVSGNFQENNFGSGGLGVDAVQANAQDGAGYNNANFATPPDGQRPRMRMYVWTTEDPYLDGDLDNGIIIHEYAHGISNRLTGGPSNSNCLGSGESGGMGEGWGDCYSLAFRWRSQYDNSTVFGMGVYAAGEGIRLYDYAQNMTINPQTYSYINGAQYGGVHAKGCYWCTVLYDAYLELVDKYGFDANLYTGNGGNNRWLLLVTDGMKLQPCRPTMVDARDAILESNENNFGGADVCDLWRVFARRGLGVSATTGARAVDGFDIPSNC